MSASAILVPGSRDLIRRSPYRKPGQKKKPSYEEAKHVAAKGDAKSLDARGRLAAPQGDADDLKQIKGVGPAFEKKLNEAGIFHFWQVAALSAEQVASLEEELAFQGRMERDDWKGQAEQLMSEG